jgi:hypothetical protein
MIDEKVLIERLEESEERYDDVSFAQLNEFGHTLDYEYAKGKRDGMAEAKEIVNDLASEHNNGWIPCEVVDHPEHCHDCEVTIKDVYGYTREIAYYTDKWRLLRDETPVMVVAWKEPSAPYKKGE